MVWDLWLLWKSHPQTPMGFGFDVILHSPSCIMACVWIICLSCHIIHPLTLLMGSGTVWLQGMAVVFVESVPFTLCPFFACAYTNHYPQSFHITQYELGATVILLPHLHQCVLVECGKCFCVPCGIHHHECGCSPLCFVRSYHQVLNKYITIQTHMSKLMPHWIGPLTPPNGTRPLKELVLLGIG